MYPVRPALKAQLLPNSDILALQRRAADEETNESSDQTSVQEKRDLQARRATISQLKGTAESGPSAEETWGKVHSGVRPSIGSYLADARKFEKQREQANADISDKTKREMQAVKSSYYAGYLPQALKRNPDTTTPAFRYEENLPVALPTLPGTTHKGFVFAGSFPNVHDLQAKGSILQGDFVRCESALEILDPRRKRSKEVDVIITGTTDREQCGQVKNAFLRDVAYQAASNSHLFDPQAPYADTPVFQRSEGGLEATGDLTDMSETARKQILDLNFTACNFYALQKTRLSDGHYKNVGAIAAGIMNDEVCDFLHFGELQKQIDQTKKQ